MKQKLENNHASSLAADDGAIEGATEGAIDKQIICRNSDRQQQTQPDKIAQEVAIAFSYNGQSHAVMMASPINLTDFAIGFSFTEQIINSLDDILDIEIQAATQGICINLQINPKLLKRLESRRRQLSGRSGCGICGIADLAAALPKLDALRKSELPDHTTIDQAVTTLLNSQILQKQCGAVHCAALFDRAGQLLAIREDVGRHNALDKLIGANINQLEHSHFILLSSRASHELVAKTIIAGIGTLACISAATDLAIEMAEQCNLNLIGFIRGSRQIVYSGQEAGDDRG